jgi:hypothetical protein
VQWTRARRRMQAMAANCTRRAPTCGTSGTLEYRRVRIVCPADWCELPAAFCGTPNGQVRRISSSMTVTTGC